jgi:phosphatidate phosphatase PAH1
MKKWFAYVGPALLITFLACDDPGEDTPGVDAGAPMPDAMAPVDASPAGPLFQSCTDGALPSGLPTVDWSNPLNDVITLGDPWHSAQDIIAATAGEAALAGKFAYGDVSKDLEGERVEVWIDDCAGGYRMLGERTTDSDGRMTLALTGDALPATGEYGVYFRVMGDDSAARAVLRVYPPGTQLIVFDIDATLTTSDTELVGEIVASILAGITAPPTARVGAMEVTALRRDQHGYELVYLTGRPYLLDGITRAWLADLDFPGGTVHVTDDVADSWPSDSQVGDYKAAFLQQLMDKGFTFYAAYGNAASDIHAYEVAGVPKERTYILGSRGGDSGTVALGESYTAHIEAVRDEPAAEQPFRR